MTDSGEPLEALFPNVEKSMFRAIHGVQLDTFPGFKYRGQSHSFLEFYDGTAWCPDGEEPNP